MFAYIIRRIFWAAIILLILSLVTFTLMHMIPGGPFDREKKLPSEIIANLEAYYHLDEPFWKQYLNYLGGILHFDLGPSFTSRSRTVNDIIRQQAPISAQLGLFAFFIAVALGIPLGILGALKQNTAIDYTCMWLAILGVSLPNMALGPFLIWIFGLKLGWLPIARWGGISHMILPAITLGTAYSAIIARLTRASMLQVIREDYIRTARAKGLSERIVMLHHALKNALIPVTTVLGPIFAIIITGSMIVEQIFAIPGIGKYFVTSVTNRDYPVIMGITLFFGALIVIANLVVDITYGFLDPRIRYE
jgi:ABC-type dipeptide/oligopeptide/nickel transport system permease component